MKEIKAKYALYADTDTVEKDASTARLGANVMMTECALMQCLGKANPEERKALVFEEIERMSDRELAITDIKAVLYQAASQVLQ